MNKDDIKKVINYLDRSIGLITHDAQYNRLAIQVLQNELVRLENKQVTCEECRWRDNAPNEDPCNECNIFNCFSVNK